MCDPGESKGPATRNDIVDFSSSTMAFNVAKIASSARSLTISLTKSLRVAGPLVGSEDVEDQRRHTPVTSQNGRL